MRVLPDKLYEKASRILIFGARQANEISRYYDERRIAQNFSRPLCRNREKRSTAIMGKGQHSAVRSQRLFADPLLSSRDGQTLRKRSFAHLGSVALVTFHRSPTVSGLLKMHTRQALAPDSPNQMHQTTLLNAFLSISAPSLSNLSIPPSAPLKAQSSTSTIF